jgi:hypothetical protein
LGPRGIISDGNGSIWFTEFSGGKIATVAPGTHVVVSSPPPTALKVGATFGLTVTVELDSGGVDTGYQGSVTATVIGAGGTSLAGTTTVTVTNGVATFSGLSLSGAGSYAIQVNASGVGPAPIGTLVVSAPPVAPPILPPVTPPTGSAPVLIGDHLVMAGNGRNRYVAGIVLTFSAPLDAASARNSANYTVIQTSSAGRAKAVRAVRLRAVYKPATKSVRLTLAGEPRFAVGGQLIVNGSKPNGIASPAGVRFQGNMGDSSGANGLYEILAGARGIAP